MITLSLTGREAVLLQTMLEAPRSTDPRLAEKATIHEKVYQKVAAYMESVATSGTEEF